MATIDLSTIGSSETLMKIHGRNAEAIKEVNDDLPNGQSKIFLECLEIINDIIFLPHSADKTAKVIEALNGIPKNFKNLEIYFYLGNQPFFHHAAISADEPEILEKAQDLFPRYRTREGDNF